MNRAEAIAHPTLISFSWPRESKMHNHPGNHRPGSTAAIPGARRRHCAPSSFKYGFLFLERNGPSPSAVAPSGGAGARARKGNYPMGTAEEYRRIAWDCLKLAEATSNPQTSASMLNLAQDWVRLAEQAERNDQHRE